ncbi:MAG: phenylalanine--tRNA ligase subunit beta [Gammaproteobacteria bacterium]
MKFSEQWLREWVSPLLTTNDLAEQLTMAGLEVEGIESCHRDFTHLIVARLEEINHHPNADNLNVCRLDVGAGNRLTVVCGAENVCVGHCYALAMAGAVLPDGRKIVSTEIYGVRSEGMLCSAAELELSDRADMLLELDSGAEPGTELQEFLLLDDHVIDFSLTPNRGDCLSIAGIAREVAALNGVEVRRPDIEPIDAITGQERKVRLDAADACPRYVGRVIEDIDINQVPPTWLTEKLRRSGIRSINNVVDIMNYVMLELGQPMHAFDNDLLQGEITVRYAGPGEKLALLDGQTCSLTVQTLVIADESRAVAMAGIMGGLDTSVTQDTHHIFLESAFFSPEAILGRARLYGLHTDSSQRFERGVDYTLQRLAVERATQLILEYCGGNPGPVTEAIEAGNLPTRSPVNLRPEKVYGLLGIEIENGRIIEILQRLKMQLTKKSGYFEVCAPPFRFDIEIEADLIEEIARVYGYDRLPSARLDTHSGIHPSPEDTNHYLMRHILVNRNYHEAITYSFVDEKLQARMHGTGDAIRLLNPISSDAGVMRQSLWPGLLMALQYNIKRQQQRLRLFEYGRIFNFEAELRQEPVLSGIIYGKLYEKQWDIDDILCDFFDIKGDVEALLGQGRPEEEVEYREITHAALHPGQSAGIFYDNQSIGLIGAVHPAILSELDITLPVFVFELYLSRFPSKKKVKFTKISKFPSVRRDIAILVDREIAVHEIMKHIKTSCPDLLDNLELFDVYMGEGIDLEKKSLALCLTFMRTSSTLTDGEVDNTVEEILNTLHSRFGATLRE